MIHLMGHLIPFIYLVGWLLCTDLRMYFFPDCKFDTMVTVFTIEFQPFVIKWPFEINKLGKERLARQ